jgi:hypothetical protein
MHDILLNIVIPVNEKLLVKNSKTSKLGKKIIQNSILLIDAISFESFIFKKLGEKIKSNESSIYCYFENKHKLMIYLSSRYWGWIEYRLAFATADIIDLMKRLKKAINVVTAKIEDGESISHINESVLNKIIIQEFTKTLLTKEVDIENKEGFFLIYKRVINRIVAIIIEVISGYDYAKSLA